MPSFIQAITDYVPRSRHLAGLIAVLIGSLFCLWLNTSLDVWSHGRI
ncbi:MAG TPA: YeiH family putative sulfate export transporter, partial [Psychrobacter sp.]|nr:YeiH family putative sulfate export transporter [Psychrobacter sp.]